MLGKKLLIPYDDSELSAKALAAAMEIAANDPAVEIQVLHVVTIPLNPYLITEAIQDYENSVKAYGQALVSKAKEALSSLPNPVQTFVEQGQPSAVILHHIKDHTNDLVIMGSRGLSGIREFLGSVSHNVVQHSPVPVFIIK